MNLVHSGSRDALAAAAGALVAALALALAGCATAPAPGADAQAQPRRGPDAFARSGTEETDERKRARIRTDLAANYYSSRNYQVALEELRQALTIDPNYPAAHGMLGLVYMDLNDRSRAEESFQRALRLAPGDAEILNNYGWFLCQTSRPKEAIPQFLKALEDPLYRTPSRPLHNAGICAQRSGDEAGAEVYFQRAFQVDPSDPVAMFNLAEIQLRRGDVKRAQFYAERLSKTYQPSAETLWLSTRVARKANDRDSMASYGSQLRRMFPNSREAGLLSQGRYDD